MFIHVINYITSKHIYPRQTANKKYSASAPHRPLLSVVQNKNVVLFGRVGYRLPTKDLPYLCLQRHNAFRLFALLRDIRHSRLSAVVSKSFLPLLILFRHAVGGQIIDSWIRDIPRIAEIPIQCRSTKFGGAYGTYTEFFNTVQMKYLPFI